MKTGTARSWLRAALLLAVCMVATTLIAAPLSCPPALSGAGQATAYDFSGTGACSLPVAEGSTVAVSPALFGGAARCGECLLITGPAGSIVARVADRCFSCNDADLDVNTSTWDVIANQEDGQVAVTWQRVACPVDGNVLFGFQGSNPFYLKIQAQNHRYGTLAMDYLNASSWVPMERTVDNHFEASGVPTIQNVTVRLTATTGQSIEAVLGDPGQTGLINSGKQFARCEAEVFSDRFEWSPE